MKIKKALTLMTLGIAMVVLLSSCQPDVVPTSVTLEPTSLTLKVGEEATIKAIILPSAASQMAAWECQNKKIAYASLTQDPTVGRVKALAPGTTTIKVVVPNYSNSPSCTVTVTE